MADNKTNEPIRGRDWHKEVINRSYKREKIREEFYRKLAELRLRTDLQKVIDNPAASGLKTFEELQKAQTFSRVVNPKFEKYETGKGWTLSECLHSYFKNKVGVTDRKARQREIALTLHYLTQQQDVAGRPINVDYLNAGWTVEFREGRMYITDRKGKKMVDGVYLRKPPPPPPPKPKPPEEPKEEPLSPEEIEDELLKLDHPNYTVLKKVTIKSDDIIGHDKEIEGPRISQTDSSGHAVTFDVLFIGKKGVSQNPPFFLAVNRNNPYEIGIGKMKYESGFFSDTAKFGNFDSVFHLDKKNRARTLKSMRDMLDTLP